MRGKYTYSFALFAAVIIVLVTFLGYVTFRAHTEHTVQQEMKLIVQNSAQKLDGWLINKAAVLRTIEAQIQVLGIERVAMEATQNTYLQVNGSDPHVTRPYIGLADGRFVTGIDWTPGKDYDPRNREWYKDAVAKGELGFSTPYIDADTLNFTVSAVLPIYDADRKVTGVLGEDIFLDTLKSEVAHVTMDEGGYGFLYDQHGFILAHPNANYVTRYTSDIDYFQRIQLGKEEESGVISFQEGKDRYLVYTEIMPKTGWTMGYVVKQDIVYQPVRDAFLRFLIINVVALSLLYILSRYYVRMEKQVSQYADQLAQTVEKYDVLHAEVEDARVSKELFSTALRQDVKASVDGIKGMVTFLTSHSEPLTQKSDIDFLKESVENLSKQIDEFFAYSRSETTPFDIRSDILDARYIAGMIEKMYGDVFDKAQVGMAIEVHEDVPERLIGDTSRMIHILSSMIYTTLESEDVRDIRLLMLYLGGKLITRISVNRKGSSTLNADHLAIPQMVAEHMGGQVVVQDHVISCTIPMIEVDRLSKEEIKREALMAAMPERAEALGVSALIVEPKPTNSKVLELVLETLRINAEVSQSLPDLGEVLPPIGFVRMDHEWTDQEQATIRDLNEKWFSIAVYHKGQDQLKSRAFEMGFDTFLEHPISREKVETRVKLFRMKYSE